jgi:hypothetical protein
MIIKFELDAIRRNGSTNSDIEDSRNTIIIGANLSTNLSNGTEFVVVTSSYSTETFRGTTRSRE